MTYNELLKSGVPAGGYLFYGEEDYLKSHTAARIRTLLFPDEGLADFNRRTFTGETYTPGDLAEAILSPAMMVEKKLIEVTLPDGQRPFFPAGSTGIPCADGRHGAAADLPGGHL